MNERIITNDQINAYTAHLRSEERAGSTIEKYKRDLRAFALWLGGRPVSRELAAAWKDHLLSKHYAPATINAMLSPVNGIFRFLDWGDCYVKFLNIQRKLFRDRARELTRAEYGMLVRTAETQGKYRLSLLIESICSTGIRVSEVRYLTVEAARAGRADISLKGKIRTILLPNKLCRKLLKYARSQKIAAGQIFLTRTGRPLDRRQIWAEMKKLCQSAGVECGKVFPHNLRHLFATVFYRATHDIAMLADVLGHSSVETTRIYLISTGTEHARTMNSLRLIS